MVMGVDLSRDFVYSSSSSHLWYYTFEIFPHWIQFHAAIFFPWSKHKNNAVSRREHLALGHSQRGLAGTVLSMYILMWYAGFTVHSKSLSGSRCSLKSVELLDTEPPQGHGFIFSMKACQQGSIAGSLVNYVYTLITSHCPSHELPLNTKRKRANGFFNSEGLISAHP